LNLSNIFFSRTICLILTRLSKNHPLGEEIHFYSNEGIAVLQGEIIAKLKIHWKFFKSCSPEPAGQNQSNLEQIILRWREFKFVQIKGQVVFKDNHKNVKMGWGHLFLLKNYEARKAKYYILHEGKLVKIMAPENQMGQMEMKCIFDIGKIFLCGSRFSRVKDVPPLLIDLRLSQYILYICM
jgi:hypothetical protein